MARILVVDDERDVADLIKFMLNRDGHECTVLYDGGQALKALGLEPADAAQPVPDLVILDVMMPVADGYAVCARMREDARTKDIPVLILTAKTGMQDLHQLAANAARHLAKPFDPKALRRLVAAMLEGTR
ncbi:MAG: hypothetical protein A2X40_08275 [Elusimicrobia bacterium GWC2_65_9]|nr:MAG: hypothetical protein A2X37_09615 [Elusimicrobia bacterium GWA2_66_18]OGR68935.1 MAG: hypothetical protein A2X40_08275 [Elusimicrobia bacterium GWC2_65_9]